ncbi:uncharacterized protein MELLADRAFT_111242 [Melampsora larici-populina 98AG31]|uniref:Uncharacterized protein n=1 Tax=Melampsora larici-populina (strain 98AG31 / pathotype 3-4-7) TaxID=747676 RepID=F4S2H9_MELLP|nr:uncharacterized protein MELLADRAFT_111242 [Melampsora larici-populina 98AG31]EGG01180.1 hypothetical protein MELLADRAFT_111242 [Melampsora larici-populina 98AG31]
MAAMITKKVYLLKLILETVNGMTLRGPPLCSDIGGTSSLVSFTAIATVEYSPMDLDLKENMQDAPWFLTNQEVYAPGPNNRILIYIFQDANGFLIKLKGGMRRVGKLFQNLRF